MLVLSRRVGERIIIGNKEIVIEVLEVAYGKVRLAFTADKNIAIHREEIYNSILTNPRGTNASSNNKAKEHGPDPDQQV